MHTINTGLMKDFLSKGNQFLIDYLYLEGDSQETLMQKKIWWILTMAGLPFLIVMSLVISDKMGIEVVIINTIFALAMIVSLLIFHFQRNNIERHALFIEITILSLTVIKVYLMGGLLEAGGAIFIGMISPLYALTTPNRKRAIFLYLIYLAGMIAATELQPDIVHNYFLFYYYMGFALGITMAFSGLYYYTGELERLKQKEKLRMEELDQLKNNFYTHITHEFRTPLTIILGMADQIREDRERNLDQGLEMITRNGKKLLNMTNQLLDLSKMEAMLMPVHWVQQDIIGYLKYLVESFHSFAEASHIDLSYSIDEDSLVMDFDPDKINDILTNLISNAIKFTPEGGKVRVKAFREEINGENRLQLLVIDNGPGIAKAYLPRVFERYFQAKRHEDEYTEGSGLGLAITRELVFLMKGNISVSSELNEGTTFSVTIPISNKAKREAVIYPTKTSSVRLGNTGSEMESFAPEHKGKLKLLIVEDSKDVAAYLNSLLSLKYEISNAWNGVEGLELAIDMIPDLIISDVMMPLMDGFTLCRKLKNDMRTSHIPIILLTARNERASRMEGLRAGVDAYLVKPFNKEELFVRLDKLIALRKELRDSFHRMTQVSEKSFLNIQTLSDINLSNHGQEYAFMSRVYEILKSHLSEEEFGIAELCVSLGMSRSQLYRKFSSITDTSVHQFIRNLRLIKAQELLRSTDLNVTEVAYDTGFKNPSHFSRVYSEHFGITPSKEKKKVMV